MQVNLLDADLYSFICVGILQRLSCFILSVYIFFCVWYMCVCSIHVCIRAYVCRYSCMCMAKLDIQNHLGHFSTLCIGAGYLSVSQHSRIWLILLVRLFWQSHVSSFQAWNDSQIVMLLWKFLRIQPWDFMLF